MSIGYVTFSGGTVVEYDDFNTAIAAALTDPEAVFTVTATLDAIAECQGIRTIFEAGSTAAVYGGKMGVVVPSVTLELTGGAFLANVCGGDDRWGNITGDVSIAIGAGAVIGASNVLCIVEGVGGRTAGAVDVTVSFGGTLFGSLYGVQKLSYGCTAHSVSLSVTGGTIANDLYGSGAGNVSDAVAITVTDGAAVGGSVYGVGSGTASGAANITVTHEASVGGSVYGVGTGIATGAAEITLSDVSIEGEVCGVGSGTAGNDVTVSISGTEIDTVTASPVVPLPTPQTSCPMAASEIATAAAPAAVP